MFVDPLRSMRPYRFKICCKECSRSGTSPRILRTATDILLTAITNQFLKTKSYHYRIVKTTVFSYLILCGKLGRASDMKPARSVSGRHFGLSAAFSLSGALNCRVGFAPPDAGR